MFLGVGSQTSIVVSQTEKGPVQSDAADSPVGRNGARDPKAHAPQMQGLVTFTADGAEFMECSTGQVYRVTPDQDFPALEHAYLAAGKEPGASILATFNGTVVGDGDGDQETPDAVRVTRFVGVWPDVTCERAMSQASLTNTYWKFRTVFGTQISESHTGKDPHLILLNEDQRFTATVGCNQFMGQYTLNGADIAFGTGVATARKACPEPQVRFEELLQALMTKARRWKISDGQLTLMTADGVPIATLQAVSMN